MTQNPLFSLEDLHVSFQTLAGPVQAVRGVNISINAGECLGLVGESGSGKSQTMLAALGLLDHNGTARGQVRFEGRDVLALSRPELDQVRGRQIGMIFQDPLTSLTPHLSVRKLLGETLTRHGTAPDQIYQRSLDWLERVHIPDPVRRMEQFPHELSGGMRQRLMIAASMACEPRLLIADEPTTALDVTVQAEILELMDELKRERGIGLLLITHDMGVVARMCDRVAVMREGLLVEQNTTEAIFAAPQSDYTKALIEAAPRMNRPSEASLAPPDTSETVLDVQNLHVKFAVANPSGNPFARPALLPAVNGVDFQLKHGETIGIVGESGCGKSSLARAVIRLLDPTSGRIVWLGQDIAQLSQKDMRPLRSRAQIVFQDPLASLDPRMKAAQSVAEPLSVFRPELSLAQRRQTAIEAMQRTGLGPELADRYPHQLSGGQNQRLGIARAMIVNPSLLVCDEAVSALDVTVQAKIITLLRDIQRESGISILFISHDLSVVKDISHRVMVLYLGRVVEMAPRATLFGDPRHPYTQALLSASPQPDPATERSRTRIRLEGELPSPFDPQALFRFLPSRKEQGGPAPKLIEVAPQHWVAEHD